MKCVIELKSEDYKGEQLDVQKSGTQKIEIHLAKEKKKTKYKQEMWNVKRVLIKYIKLGVKRQKQTIIDVKKRLVSMLQNKVVVVETPSYINGEMFTVFSISFFINAKHD